MAALLFLLLAGPAARAQAPAWQRAISFTDNAGAAIVKATAVDASGDVYLAGDFTGQSRFGTTVLTSASNSDKDVFVAKWSRATNDFVWAQRAGGQAEDGVSAMAVAGTCVYLTGAFRRTATFGTTTLTNADAVYNTADVFVARLTDMGSSGRFDWAQPAGGVYAETANNIAVSGASVYVVGRFYTATTFGTTTLTSAGSDDVFVTKLVDAGTNASFLWSQRVGGTVGEDAYGLAVNGSSVYVGGTFASPTLNFGGTTLTNASSSVGNDSFLAKMTDLGSSARFDWVQQIGGAGSEEISAVAVSGPNVFVVGGFTQPVWVGTTPLASAGNRDGFVAKLVDAGATAAFRWARAVGGSAYDGIEKVAISGADLYVSGGFASPSIGLGATTLTNAGSGGSLSDFDVFVAKLTDTGTASSVAWALRAGSPGPDNLSSVSVAGSGTVYASGMVNTPATFGALAIPASAGGYVSFFASLGDVTPTATAAAPAALPTLALFPNPAHGTATVPLPAVPGAATATLTVLDALGRSRRTLSAPTNSSAVLDLAGLAPGLYAVRMAAGGRTATQRLVVE